jgi:hypothetical protein
LALVSILHSLYFLYYKVCFTIASLHVTLNIIALRFSNPNPRTPPFTRGDPILSENRVCEVTLSSLLSFPLESTDLRLYISSESLINNNPSTNNGCDYVFVVVDKFSKTSILAPYKNIVIVEGTAMISFVHDWVSKDHYF